MIVINTSGSSYKFNGKTYQCPIELSIALFAGRWKPTIIYKLLDGKKRYGELKKLIEGINHKVLAEQLRDLEANGIITRRVFPTNPPKVEYELTPLGEGLRPAIDHLQQWGLQFQAEHSKTEPATNGCPELAQEQK
ncbi:helix-turn-helix transcriptional regulator [Paenibacillus sp. SC116]|uniref:winged helix-turn-helix transcriptional regulator n=1 Tax=Paenibacillus sp. SC116 TaxID=2968986 RepID=UPI00215A7AE7|nr:helix-turn-helix domain-containing protein [Paenibacillus sp. SC116]MCR8844529.1 helix-turn-helix transcriptional regulator [Paenibacillus sp. SC116]